VPLQCHWRDSVTLISTLLLTYLLTYLPPRVIHFRKLFSGTFPSQILCLYLEPFKSNRALKLTIVKKSLQKFNVCGIIADTPGDYRPVLYIFRKLFSRATFALQLVGLYLGGTDKRPRDKRPPDKRPQDKRPLRQKATGQKATERNVKMLLSCQDVLERLRMVFKKVEQIVLYVSSVLVCRPSLFVVYLSSVLVNCSTTATVCIGQDSPC